ncbi:hypothetical protein [Gordonia sp. OPL2]|uniref:hypothetical protein n=1 Tax=Gordonia sp. OPL2 TaxID=2486274 RepID=UPI0016562763|nr:hypothetical protein [Gordonia sp. OPL2]RPA02574.1 hypothetical protein EEB19_10965 [Gordonia sp. OPL2]
MAARPLDAREAAILDRIVQLVPGGAGKDLAAQLGGLRIVESEDPTHRFWQFDNNATRRAEISDGPLPVSAEVWEAQTFEGEIIVFVREGLLSSFEFAWVTQDPPSGLPDADSVRYYAG